MSVSAYALTTVDRVLNYLGVSRTSLNADALTVYCSASDASTATVQVTATTLVLIITGGTSAGTNTITFTDADSNTLTKIVAKINAVTGWVANLSGVGNASSSDLAIIAATNAKGSNNTVTLEYYNVYLIERMIDTATARIEAFCNRQLYTRTHTNERYDGTGEKALWLKNYPVTAITGISIGAKDIVEVKNSYLPPIIARAMISLSSGSSGSLTLTIIGGSYAGSDSVSFASNATVASLVTAVNAVGKGWSAQLINSDYSSFPTSELLDKFNESAINTWSPLQVPGEYIGGYIQSANDGIIYARGIFPEGIQNIIVTYTAGYTSTTLPEDLIQACTEYCTLMYREKDKDLNLISEELGDYSYRLNTYQISSQIPDSIKSKIVQYRRYAS